MNAASARPWRPLGTGDLLVASERLNPVLDHFSRRWFTALRLRVDDATLVAPGAPRPPGLQAAGGLGVVPGPRLFTDWALQALGLPASALRQNPLVSERLVDGMARRMAQDLNAALRAASMPEAVNAPDDDPWTEGGAVRLTVCAGALGRSDIALWCPLPVLSRWAPTAARLPIQRAADAARPLVPRRAALGSSIVHLEALAGTVRLPAASLVGLEPGDVLVLDQSLTEPCLLRDTHSHQTVARGFMRRSGQHLTLELQPS